VSDSGEKQEGRRGASYRGRARVTALSRLAARLPGYLSGKLSSPRARRECGPDFSVSLALPPFTRPDVSLSAVPVRDRRSRISDRRETSMTPVDFVARPKEFNVGLLFSSSSVLFLISAISLRRETPRSG